MEARTFANPTNGYTEAVGLGSGVWTLLLGPLFLAFRRAWLAVAMTVVFAPLIVGGGFLLGAAISGGASAGSGTPGLVFGALSWVVWSVLMQPLIATAYLKRGWREVAPSG